MLLKVMKNLLLLQQQQERRKQGLPEWKEKSLHSNFLREKKSTDDGWKHMGLTEMRRTQASTDDRWKHMGLTEMRRTQA